MKSKISALWFVLLVAGACSSEPPGNEDSDGDSRCTPGASIECACVDGSKGAQVCADDGTLDTCQCAGQGGTGSGGAAPSGGTSAGGTSGTGPSAGTSSGGTGGVGGTATGGQSGTTGVGGTSTTGGSGAGSGGSGAYGNPDSEHIYFEGTVTYESGGYPPLARQLTVCALCEAEYDSTNTPSGRLTFWVGEDTPQWDDWADMSMMFYPDGIQFRPAEYIEPYDGVYAQDPFDTVHNVPYADSCIHAEDRLIENGGHVTGTLDCTLSRRSANMPGATMHVVGSFHAEFPSANPTPP